MTEQSEKSVKKAGRAPGRGDRDEREPVNFFGYPEALQGLIRLTNTSDEQLRTLVIKVDSCELRTPGGSRLTEIVARPRLPSGATALVPAFIALDPATAPGSYPAEIVLGDDRVAAVFHVAERTSVSVTPSVIVLESRPGASFEKTLFIQNHGNVPLHLGDIGIVVMEAEDLTCRVMRASAAHLEHPDLDTTLGTVVDNIRREYEEAAPLKIRTLNKPVKIPPATTVKADIRIQVPESLKKGLECHAYFRMWDASVTLLLRAHNA